MDIDHVLVILADSAGHRALPVRLHVPYNKLWRLLSRPDHRDEEQGDAHDEEMTGRLLQAAGVTLAGVTITDLGPGVTVTRIAALVTDAEAETARAGPASADCAG
jgi:hypothetical protein